MPPLESTSKLLTKSLFKTGLQCPTALAYVDTSEYFNQSNDDPFLQALANGGFQVGALAKYLFCDEPEKEFFTVETINKQLALDLTRSRRAHKHQLLAEAAFQHENLLVRTDITVEEEDVIHLYEVKSKGWDRETEFLKEIKRGPQKGQNKLNPDWRDELYDIAFQKYVCERDTGKRVKAYTILVNKDEVCTVNGLNQLFRVKEEDGRLKITSRTNLTRSELGHLPLKIINVDEVCDWIYSNPVEVDVEGVETFEQLIDKLCNAYTSKERIKPVLGSKCKACTYKNPDFPQQRPASGFHECWKEVAGLTNNDFDQDLVLSLWAGKTGAKNIVKEALDRKHIFLKDVPEDVYAPNKYEAPGVTTLDSTQRRTIQIHKAARKDFVPYLDLEGLTDLFDQLPAPFHFIDFETTMTALPFHAGRKPYEAVAFQYSYHVMEADGSIRHENEFLHFDAGVFPNYEFLRSLQKDLFNKTGTIFRYHSHENTYLNHIYRQLMLETVDTVPDKFELMAFIEQITEPGRNIPKSKKWTPINPMQDLYDLVLKHFYSLYAKGSNSIKDILPSVINSSDYIRKKYSKPIYGTEQIPSRNFRSHCWIDETMGNNPYKTLPPITDASGRCISS
ncbi:DUF2779 domain-containing protein [Telluribacter sp.]|jgi:hypothetical protein|uniref:DUF2779 domain-containing protein n=1 Tax=Telluribacter sp. TaxID=1978767 RepID=UPI002E15854B|nr:DUF2779 domain-containing protein [Telluribacter sp.]